jgi:hypothetical protein
MRNLLKICSGILHIRRANVNYHYDNQLVEADVFSDSGSSGGWAPRGKTKFI